MTCSVVVIGAGNIAGGFDRPGSSSVLTHLHAIDMEERFTCTALYDLDQNKARGMAARWGVPVATSLEEAFGGPVDMAVIAVPDQHHADYLVRLLDYDVRLVLCEKPLTTDVDQTCRIMEQYERAGRALAVNYQRRFEDSVLELKASLLAGELGKPVAGMVWYSKGVLHNGSHAVDLLRFLFGDVQKAVARRKVMDFTETDPSIAGTLRFKDVDIELNIGDERLFSLFEIDLMFEKARYRYTQGGIVLERFQVLPDPVYPGYQELQSVWRGETSLTSIMGNVYRSFGDYLDKKAPLEGAAADVIGTQIACAGLASQPFDRWFAPNA